MLLFSIIQRNSIVILLLLVNIVLQIVKFKPPINHIQVYIHTLMSNKLNWNRLFACFLE